MLNKGKNLFFIILLLVVLGLAFDFFQNNMGPGNGTNIPISELLDKTEEGQISDITIQGNYIHGHLSDGSNFSSYSPFYPGLMDKLKANNVKVEIVPTDNKVNSLFGMLISAFPIILLCAGWIFLMRHMQGSGGKAMGFGKSRARLLTEKTGKITFADVAGIDEAKDELSEIVDFLREPAKFQSVGGKIPKGCLLVGPPGTGKTLLARAIAGEANVPFFTISGSDFVEMFVGVGASRVRDMFEQGKKNAPCIIFIDEIDAVGRHRGIGLGGGNDEREQTLNQLLVEMDGFEPNEGVILIAATNRPDVLDPALLRPGRFDRQIVVPTPDIAGREKILKVHLAKVSMGPDVDARVIARGTPGFSGADLANLVNEAALLAARRNKKIVTMPELEEAKDKVMMGAERRSMVMSDDEKKLTAYHEGGHALVGINCAASDPIHKATIIPRGRALGLVMRLPESDRFSVTREKLKADIAVAMGGRVAEELIFGYDKVTSGASSDIQQATKMAQAMVTEWGMSDKLGPLFYGGERQDAYLSGGSSHHKGRSEDTNNLIDSEVRSLVEEGYNLAQKILKDNIDKLHAIARALLEYETLSGDDIKNIIDGKKINRNFDNDDKGQVISSTFPKNDDKQEPTTSEGEAPQQA
jgi:cell division protease FtsH